MVRELCGLCSLVYSSQGLPHSNTVQELKLRALLGRQVLVVSPLECFRCLRLRRASPAWSLLPLAFAAPWMDMTCFLAITLR